MRPRPKVLREVASALEVAARTPALDALFKAG